MDATSARRYPTSETKLETRHDASPCCSRRPSVTAHWTATSSLHPTIDDHHRGRRHDRRTRHVARIHYLRSRHRSTPTASTAPRITNETCSLHYRTVLPLRCRPARGQLHGMIPGPPAISSSTGLSVPAHHVRVPHAKASQPLPVHVFEQLFFRQAAVALADEAAVP